MSDALEPTFFRNAAALRRWFARHHASARELLVGYHKVGSATPSITWPASVDEALCVGWIDGVRRRLDEHRYTIRFTPRRANSVWSNINIARARALQAQGRMTAAGLAAFEARRDGRSGVYSFEQSVVELAPAYARKLRRHHAAHADFERRAPSYRKAVLWWIVSAKQEATRQRRLAALIDHATRGVPLKQFSRR